MRRAVPGPAKPGIEPVVDSAAAQAFVDTLDPEVLTVSALVPPGYESYARILHPAWRLSFKGGGAAGWLRARDRIFKDDGSLRFSGGELARSPVRWSEVASLRGTDVHRRMQWPEVWSLPAFEKAATAVMAQAGMEPIEAPDDGVVPLEVARVLIELLGMHTRAHAKCWFGIGTDTIWPYKEGIAPTARVGTGVRSWDVYRAPLKRLSFDFLDSREVVRHSATLVWAQDRSWCLGTNAEVHSTYVGGPEKLIARILRDTRLEAYEAFAQDDCWEDPENPPGFEEGVRIGFVYEKDVQPLTLRNRIRIEWWRLGMGWRARWRRVD